MMLLSRVIFRKYGWGVAAQITPTVLLITGVAFFALVLFSAPLTPALASINLTPLMAAVLIGAAQNVFSKSAKYSLFDPCKEMAYIPLDQETQLKVRRASMPRDSSLLIPPASGCLSPTTATADVHNINCCCSSTTRPPYNAVVAKLQGDLRRSTHGMSGCCPSVRNQCSREGGIFHMLGDLTWPGLCVPQGKAAIDVVCNPLGKSGGSAIQQVMIICFGSLAASTPYLGAILLGVVIMWIGAANSLNKQACPLRPVPCSRAYRHRCTHPDEGRVSHLRTAMPHLPFPDC